MSYEGYGIRARKDLSANFRAEFDETRALQEDELDRAGRFLIGLCKEAEQKRSNWVNLPVKSASRLADALLLAAHRTEVAP